MQLRPMVPYRGVEEGLPPLRWTSSTARLMAKDSECVVTSLLVRVTTLLLLATLFSYCWRLVPGMIASLYQQTSPTRCAKAKSVNEIHLRIWKNRYGNQQRL